MTDIAVDLNRGLSRVRRSNLPPALAAVIVFVAQNLKSSLKERGPDPTHAVVAIVLVRVEVVVEQESLTRAAAHVEANQISRLVERHRPVALFVRAGFRPRLVQASQAPFVRGSNVGEQDPTKSVICCVVLGLVNLPNARLFVASCIIVGSLITLRWTRDH